LLRNLLNLYVARPGSRRWKQTLAQHCRTPQLEQLIELARELDGLS
jgi:hypothetical protein